MVAVIIKNRYTSTEIHMPEPIHRYPPAPPAAPLATPLNSHPNGTERPPKHHRLRWSLTTVGGIILVILIIGGWLAYRAISVVNTRKLDNANGKVGFLTQLGHLVTNDRQLQGEENDRVNILILGIGGPGHDGPYLTDTMLVASYKPSTNQLALLSIPRDLVVNIPGYDYRKINNVLSIGRDIKYPGGGEALTVKIVSDTFNIPIQYYALMDFTGFEEVINQVGGVDVTVEDAFTDYEYPTENYGYQTIHFNAGSQHMDGATALKFARSRHGNNGEGSDFARARRQQKILEALKEKLLSVGTLINPKKISDILGSLGSHSQTNMEVWEMIRLAKLVKNIKHDQIINEVIDSSINGFLRNDTGQGGAFILVPKDRNYQDIQFLAQNIFLVARVRQDHAAVAVVNASGIAGLAEKAALALDQFGIDATPLSAQLSSTKTTTVVERNPGQLVPTAYFLKHYQHTRSITALTTWMLSTDNAQLSAQLDHGSQETTTININTNGRARNVNETVTKPFDFVLVLGQDQPKSTAATLPVFGYPKATNGNTNAATNVNTNTSKTNGNSNTNAAKKTTNANQNGNINASSSKLNSNLTMPPQKVNANSQ